MAVKSPVTELYREDAGNRYPGFLKDPKATGYMWDTLAAGWLLDPGFVTARQTLYLDVETRFGARYGAVVPLDRKLAPSATPVEVMMDLDFPAFSRSTRACWPADKTRPPYNEACPKPPTPTCNRTRTGFSKS